MIPQTVLEEICGGIPRTSGDFIEGVSREIIVGNAGRVLKIFLRVLFLNFELFFHSLCLP